MHKKTKGSVAELAVATRLMKEGWRVSFPYGENARYDLVAEREGRFVRIQVKYTTPKAGVLTVNCCSSNNWSVLQYTPEEIDIVVVYNSHDERIYFVPVTQLPKGHMKLRLDPPKNNQRAKVRYATQFTELHDGRGNYEFGAVATTLLTALKALNVRAGAGVANRSSL